MESLRSEQNKESGCPSFPKQWDFSRPQTATYSAKKPLFLGYTGQHSSFLVKDCLVAGIVTHMTSLKCMLWACPIIQPCWKEVIIHINFVL